MKKTAQIIYDRFTEVFSFDIGTSLSVKLEEIRNNSLDPNEIITLDLSKNYKDLYSIFPFENGDLVLFQIENNFYSFEFTDKRPDIYKFSSTDIIKYLSDTEFLVDLCIKFSDEKNLIINSLFSDFIQNDYSCSVLNKKIKFIKTASILSYLKSRIKGRVSRVIFDETVIGDIEVEDIVLSLKYMDLEFLKTSKIDNIIKILSILNEKHILNHNLKFTDHVCLINNENKNSLKIHDIHGNVVYEYKRGEENKLINVADKLARVYLNSNNFQATGKIYIYNEGDSEIFLLS